MAEINNETHEIKEHKQVEFLMQFSASTTECCVCLVDIVGSTDTMMSLDHPQASRYYEIFLNKMADIVKKFGGVVVKNIGDSLLFYFPNTSNPKIEEFENALSCCYSMIETNHDLNLQMSQEGLPQINYRISGEYGPVIMAKISTSSTNDIFGNTVNICSKINRMAQKNAMVIGYGLYLKASNSKNYDFTLINSPDKKEYSVYSLTKRSN